MNRYYYSVFSRNSCQIWSWSSPKKISCVLAEKYRQNWHFIWHMIWYLPNNSYICITRFINSIRNTPLVPKESQFEFCLICNNMLHIQSCSWLRLWAYDISWPLDLQVRLYCNQRELTFNKTKSVHVWEI